MSLEEALHFIEEENRKFEGHWLWRKLGCRPEEFFHAFEQHLSALKIPRDQWERELKRAQEACKFRDKETRIKNGPDLRMLSEGIRV